MAIEKTQLPTPVQQALFQAIRLLSPHSAEATPVLERATKTLSARLPADAVCRWFSLGLQMARSSRRGWEGALEFFKASTALPDLPLDVLELWVEQGMRFATLSPALAVEYFRVSPQVSQRLGMDLLPEWSRQGGQFLLTEQWQAPKIAARYFEVSGEVVAYLSWSEMVCWGEIGHCLAAYYPDLALDYLTLSPKILENMAKEGRQEMLDILRIICTHSPSQALSLFHKADFLLRQIPPSCRGQVLEIVHSLAKEAGEEIRECLRSFPLLLQRWHGPAQSEICNTLLTVVRVDHQGALALLRSLPTILGQISWRDLPRWVEKGIPLLSESRPKGRAYLGLESTTSRLALQQFGKTAYLEDVRRLLHMYVTGLTGQSIPIRSLSELPPSFRLSQQNRPTTDGEIIYLPPHIDQSSTYLENFALYKVSVAHQAGHFEFGTFRFSLERLVEQVPHRTAFFESAEDGGKGIRSDFEKFFQAFPQRALAQDIFAVLEDGRIDHALWREYRGLRPDLVRVIEMAFSSRGDFRSLTLPQAMVELLAWLVLDKDLPSSLPSFFHPLLAQMRPLVAPLSRRGATVQDTAVITMQIYHMIERLPRLSLQTILAAQDQPELEELVNPFSMLDLETMAEQLARTLSPALTGEEEPYQSREPLLHQGAIKPELIQQKMKVEALREKMQEMEKGYIPPEILKELLEKGIDIQIRGVQDQPLDTTSGLFVTNLEGRGMSEEEFGKRFQEEIKQLGQEIQTELRAFQEQGEPVYFYDEWDYQIRDYRSRWCHLRERVPAGAGDGCVAKVLEEHRRLITQVRKQFELLKPEMFKKRKRLEDGEEVDLDAAIEALIDRRVGVPPSEKLYMKKDKRERDIATIFLLDISASTDDIITEEETPPKPSTFSLPPRYEKSQFSGFLQDDFYAPLFAQDKQKSKGKRIIDVEREAVVVMAEALESVGDEYAIYGFSGYGHDNVEFFILKEFAEAYSVEVRQRIEALKPQRSTRMGPAIRHVLWKFASSQARLKMLILLSDGYPQDFDYGKDRRGKTYGIQDTMMAFQEARKQGIHTFCITVDRSGKDYLKEMCGEGNYVVIEQVTALPQELLNIYRGLTT